MTNISPIQHNPISSNPSGDSLPPSITSYRSSMKDMLARLRVFMTNLLHKLKLRFITTKLGARISGYGPEELFFAKQELELLIAMSKRTTSPSITRRLCVSVVQKVVLQEHSLWASALNNTDIKGHTKAPLEYHLTPFIFALADNIPAAKEWLSTNSVGSLQFPTDKYVEFCLLLHSLNKDGNPYAVPLYKLIITHVLWNEISTVRKQIEDSNDQISEVKESIAPLQKALHQKVNNIPDDASTSAIHSLIPHASLLCRYKSIQRTYQDNMHLHQQYLKILSQALHDMDADSDDDSIHSDFLKYIKRDAANSIPNGPNTLSFMEHVNIPTQLKSQSAILTRISQHAESLLNSTEPAGNNQTDIKPVVQALIEHEVRPTRFSGKKLIFPKQDKGWIYARLVKENQEAIKDIETIFMENIPSEDKIYKQLHSLVQESLKPIRKLPNSTDIERILSTQITSDSIEIAKEANAEQAWRRENAYWSTKAIELNKKLADASTEIIETMLRQRQTQPFHEHSEIFQEAINKLLKLIVPNTNILRGTHAWLSKNIDMEQLLTTGPSLEQAEALLAFIFEKPSLLSFFKEKSMPDTTRACLMTITNMIQIIHLIDSIKTNQDLLLSTEQEYHNTKTELDNLTDSLKKLVPTQTDVKNKTKQYFEAAENIIERKFKLQHLELRLQSIKKELEILQSGLDLTKGLDTPTKITTHITIQRMAKLSPGIQAAVKELSTIKNDILDLDVLKSFTNICAYIWKEHMLEPTNNNKITPDMLNSIITFIYNKNLDAVSLHSFDESVDLLHTKLMDEFLFVIRQIENVSNDTTDPQDPADATKSNDLHSDTLNWPWTNNEIKQAIITHIRSHQLQSSDNNSG